MVREMKIYLTTFWIKLYIYKFSFLFLNRNKVNALIKLKNNKIYWLAIGENSLEIVKLLINNWFVNINKKIGFEVTPLILGLS